MSYDLGWAALNLEMPDRVPRTEYSLAEYHFPLIERVTSLKVTDQSTGAEKHAARRALREAQVQQNSRYRRHQPRAFLPRKHLYRRAQTPLLPQR